MAKTAIENNQTLIIEGNCIPFDWKKDFTEEYLPHIRYYCLMMSENYIRNHFQDIKTYANMVEKRMNDDWCTMEHVLEENAKFLALAQKYHANTIWIDDKYEINIDLWE